MPSLLQRFARITPYFRHSRLAVGVAFLASLLGALTEPLIPAMLKPLLDQGFTAGALPLWLVPVGQTLFHDQPDVDLASVRGLGAWAGLLLLAVSGEAGLTRVGIRGATDDGLPLAGPSGEPGLHLALAPRRNGWLMGPLVARVTADGIEGRPPLADAAALDPLRFA